LRRNHAIVSASITKSVVMFALIDQPTTSRLNRSSTIARYSQPSSVQIQRDVRSEDLVSHWENSGYHSRAKKHQREVDETVDPRQKHRCIFSRRME